LTEKNPKRIIIENQGPDNKIDSLTITDEIRKQHRIHSTGILLLNPTVDCLEVVLRSQKFEMTMVATVIRGVILRTQISSVQGTDGVIQTVFLFTLSGHNGNTDALTKANIFPDMTFDSKGPTEIIVFEGIMTKRNL
jgi:hypothetical protein